jgi:hypothetical protein
MMEMFKNLPKNTRKWVMGIALSVVIVSFVFFYGYESSSGNMESFVVGKVNGTPIYLSEYKREYEALSERYRDQLNNKATEKEVGRQVQQMAFNVLLQKYLILYYAKKYNVFPSEFEILVAVANMKEFRTEDGRFDENRLRGLPTYYKKQLEKQFFSDLSQQLFQMRIADAAKVSDTEVRMAFEEMNTKVKVVYLKEANIQAQTNLLIPSAPAGGDRLEKVIERMKRGADFVSAAAAENLRPELTDWFYFGGPILKAGTTNEYVSDLESNPDVIKNVFSAKKGMTSPIINLSDGRCILATVDRKEPDWTKFYEQAEGIKSQLMSRKMNDYFSEWFSSVYYKAKKDNSGLDRLFGKQQ